MMKLKDIVQHSRNSITPKDYPERRYDHYSLPAYDNSVTPAIESGDSIASNKYQVFKNSILISKLNPGTSRVWKIEDCHINSICSTEFVQLNRINTQICSLRYLYYYLCSPLITAKLKSMASGTSGSHQRVKPKDILDLEIKLPPLQEQKAIAEILSSLDDKIELLQKQNDTLEALAQTLFRQWFIEEADDSWEEVELIDVFDFKEGPGIRNWQYVEEGFPFINIRLIKNKEIDKSTANCVSNEEANGKYNHFKLEVDDFVMSTSGTLGKNAIVRDYHLPLLLNTSVIRFRPKESYLKCFMYQYLQSREFIEYLLSAASGSVQLNFGPMHLKAVSLRLPSREQLESFELNCNPFYEKINHNYKSIQTLSQTRDTLLPKLMSGQVRVKLD